MNGIRSGAVVVMFAAGLCARAQVGVGPPHDDALEKEKRAHAAREPARPDALDSKARIEPDLVRRIEALAKGETIEVGVWVRQDYDPGVQMLARLDAQQKRQDEGALIAQSRQLIAQTLAPVAALAVGLGAVVVYQAVEAPLIFLRIDGPGILTLAANGSVERIYLSRDYFPESEHSAKAVRADVVWARGINGSGLGPAWLGLVEGTNVHFNNPYMNHIAPADRIVRLPAQATGEHMTSVAGIMVAASDGTPGHHKRWRGVAYGTPKLVVANHNGPRDSRIVEAVDWAINQGARILNSSFGRDTNQQIVALDRYYDYIVRNNFMTMVKSAGNNGGGYGTATSNVTSPGMGYNVIAVGSFTPRETHPWDDDRMSAFSSFLPDTAGLFGREKPEITGSGEDQALAIDRLTNLGAPWMRSLGPGTSFAAPQVSAAAFLMVERETALLAQNQRLRAVLLAGACHNIEGSARLSSRDGAGAMVICESDEIVTNGRTHFAIVIASDFQPNGYYPHRISLNADLPARVVLCWDSNPTNERILRRSTALTDTTLTDNNAPANPFGAANSKVGWYVQPNNVGISVNPGEPPSSRSFRVVANTGTQLTVAAGSDMLTWGAAGNEYALFPDPATDLKADLDLRVVRVSDGALMGSSLSFDNNYEIVTFTPPTTGDYEIRVDDFRFDGVVEKMGLAWTQEPCCSPDFGDAPDDMLHCNPRPLHGDFPTRLISDGARVTEYEPEWLSFDNGQRPGATWETDAYVFPFDVEKDQDRISNILINACIPNLDDEDDGVQPDPVYRARTRGRVAFRVNSATPNIGRYSRERVDERIYVRGWFDWEHDDVSWDGNLMVYWRGGPTIRGQMLVGRCLAGCDLWNEANNSKLVIAEFRVPDFLPDGPFWIRFRMDYGENQHRYRRKTTYGEVEDHISYQYRYTPWDCIWRPRYRPGALTDICFSPSTWTLEGIPVATTFPEGLCPPPEEIPTYDWWRPPPDKPPTVPNDWHWNVTYTYVRELRLAVNVVNFGPDDPVVVHVFAPAPSFPTSGQLRLDVDVRNDFYTITDEAQGPLHQGQWSLFPGNLPPTFELTGAMRRNSSADPTRPGSGACCVQDPEGGTFCDDVLTAKECAEIGGVFQGVGVQCGDVSCSPVEFGACCFSDGSCALVSEADCNRLDGSFTPGESCEGCNKQPRGSCCLGPGQCIDGVTETACSDMGGAFNTGAACGSVNFCDPFGRGACCLEDGVCVDGVDETACVDLGGSFGGQGSTCATPGFCAPKTCPCDFNRDTFVNSQDFFDFLTAFFSGDPRADFNLDTFINSQDFFDFLGCFFEGC